MDKSKPAVFLDRDGVVNVDKGFVGCSEDFVLIEGAARAISLLNHVGYLVFIVTNQSGIGRGYYSEKNYDEVTAHMTRLLAIDGAHIDDIRYCPFHPEAKLERYRGNHPWRKPAPGMLLDLLENWPVDTDRSFLIGDSSRDLDAARAAGIDAFLFRGDNLYNFLAAIKPDLIGSI